jgi:hypothetical protein
VKTASSHRPQLHPLLRIGLQQPCQHLPRTLADMTRDIKIPGANLLEHVFTGGAGLKRVLARQHEEQKHPERPRVDCNTGVLLVLNNLWGSVPVLAPFNQH